MSSAPSGAAKVKERKPDKCADYRQPDDDAEQKRRTEKEPDWDATSVWGSYPVQVVFQHSAPRVQFFVRHRHALPPGQMIFSFQLLDSVHAVQTQAEAKHRLAYTHTHSTQAKSAHQGWISPCFQPLSLLLSQKDTFAVNLITKLCCSIFE